MASNPIVTWFLHLGQFLNRTSLKRHPNLHRLSQNQEQLPHFVRESPVAMRYVRLLGPLAWDHFPERNLNWQPVPVPHAPFVAACLVKLNEGFHYMSRLRAYLIEHPALTWVLGFPLVHSRNYPWGFDVDASLPTHRHFTRMLRTLPNRKLQFLLDSSISLIQAELVSIATLQHPFGTAISMDTKHILAWVKENNPKAYVSDRYNKEKQPAGDPDCRLGCKRRHNQRARSASDDPPPTPPDDPVPANTVSVGEYYWGYGSGVVATKVPHWGEFVLAERTQPFDCADVSYFFPLMTDVERRLGFRPRFAAFDAAFDAFYVYDYFHNDAHDGFAAVPFSQKGGYTQRSFDDEGLPLCSAGLPMPIKVTFIDRTRAIIEHQRAKYACPLLFPEPTGDTCPVAHARWPKGGCTADMPTSIGARLRYQLDRDSTTYKEIYKQRTATERVNSQAVALGIERPKIRNGQAIANQNTLIYVLINLRGLHRVRHRKAQLAAQTS